MALLKDMTVLDKMYELNLEYLKQLDVYIAAGEQALEELHAVKIPALEAEVAATERRHGRAAAGRPAAGGDPLRAPHPRPQAHAHDRHPDGAADPPHPGQRPEPRGEDPELDPHHRSRCGRTRSSSPSACTASRRRWSCRSRSRTRPTSCWPRTPSCSTTARPRSGARSSAASSTSRRCRRSTPTSIATLEETIRIQEEGRAKRFEAEGEIGRLQVELRQKLIELRAQAPQIGGPDAPQRLTDY